MEGTKLKIVEETRSGLKKKCTAKPRVRKGDFD